MAGGQDQESVGLDRIRDRMMEMRDIADGALAELDLAVFHAHCCGMPEEEIARHAEVEVAEVRQTVSSISRDQDIIDLGYDDSVTWVRWHRKTW